MGIRYEDLPFSIEDVASLVGLSLNRASHIDEEYTFCPFCGYKKKKLNISYRLGTYHCFHCGVHGGTLDLYKNLIGIGLDYGAVIDEICKKLNCGVQNERTITPGKRKDMDFSTIDNSVLCADLETRHRTYSKMLSMLELKPAHMRNLLARGLTKEQIDYLQYKSIPAAGFKNLAAGLLKAGCVLDGVPGFYKDSNGDWTVKFYFHPKGGGILIPYRTLDNKIQGFQIRLDVPADGRKYIWLSSKRLFMGQSCGSSCGAPLPIRLIQTLQNPSRITLYRQRATG